MKKAFITINHLEDYGGSKAFRVGDKLFLQKEPDNWVDDEAIAVYSSKKVKCGYVANSSHTVARGTCSAGRVLDSLKKNPTCVVRFILEECLIAELV